MLNDLPKGSHSSGEAEPGRELTPDYIKLCVLNPPEAQGTPASLQEGTCPFHQPPKPEAYLPHQFPP